MKRSSQIKGVFLALVCVLMSSELAVAQETREQQASEGECFKPAPLFDVNQFPGAIRKVAAYASRKLERKTVPVPDHKPGGTPCALEPHERFALFLSDWLDPVTFGGSAVSSGWEQFRNEEPRLGQGTKGFAKRYGIISADKLSGGFLTTFLYPSVFGEDPRYYRMDHGSVKKRLLHAATHVFVTHQNSGREEFNFSEWAGLASVTTVRKIYHPGATIGFQATVRQVGVGASVDIGSDILREFWPEISRKLKIPFVSRDHANQSKE